MVKKDRVSGQNTHQRIVVVVVVPVSGQKTHQRIVVFFR